jgi:hypothetical protein
MTKESIQEMRDRLSKDERVQNLIRMRAYEIFKSRRGQTGKAAHDWLQAENEVLSYLIQEESRLSAAAAEAASALPPELKATPTAKPPTKARAKQTAARKTKPASKREAPKKKTSKPKKTSDKKKS